MVTKHNQFLVERMDSDSGILDELFSMKILTREEMQDIKLACKTMQEKNRKLLHCITTKNKVQELVKVLENANQEHLAKYLKADGGEFRNHLCHIHVCRPRSFLDASFDTNFFCLIKFMIAASKFSYN